MKYNFIILVISILFLKSCENSNDVNYKTTKNVDHSTTIRKSIELLKTDSITTK